MHSEGCKYMYEYWRHTQGLHNLPLEVYKRLSNRVKHPKVVVGVCVCVVLLSRCMQCALKKTSEETRGDKQSPLLFSF